MNRLTTFFGARPGRGRKSGTNLLRVAGVVDNNIHGEMAKVSCVLSLKLSERQVWANSVDPDQTAPRRSV